MLKLTRHLPATSRRLILISQRGEGPCSMLVIRSTPNLNRNRRSYSTEAHLLKKKSSKLFWTVTGATIFTGATIVYAKQTPDFREWLVRNIPWMDNLISIVYQEDMPLTDWAITHYNKTSKSVSAFLFGREGAIVEKSPSGADPPQKFSTGTDYSLPQPSLAPCYVEEVQVEKPDVPPTKVIIADAVIPVEPPKIPVTKDLVDLEQSVHDNTKIAIDNYKKATEACVQYNKILNKIVEASVDTLDRKMFEALKKAQNERKKAVEVAHNANKQAEESMDELTKRLNSGDAAPLDAATATRRHLAKFKADLKVAQDEFIESEEASCIADRYWQRVEGARAGYLDELQALFPGVDISEQRLSMEGGDPDMLLLHTLRQVLYLQRELAEMQTVRDQRLKRAIDSREDKELIEAKVDELLAKRKYTLEQDYYKKGLKVKADADKKARDEIKKQVDLHQEILRDKLAAKEREVTQRFDAMVSESVEKQKVIFAQQLAEVRAKLKGIEESVKARARADAAARRAQSLWAAGESLLAATRRASGPGRARVDNEIKAVEKAGGDDELVKTVVKGIPPEVREKGLFTENALRENYLTMEKTALRVALVSKDGAPLPVYLLSYIQSLLLFTRVQDIPKSELENQPTDYSQMDAFDILQRARYWIERNDIAAALRYVNLLQGASRTAAATWRDSAIKHLEIKQAAEAVMAHAAASALMYM